MSSLASRNEYFSVGEVKEGGNQSANAEAEF